MNQFEQYEQEIWTKKDFFLKKVLFWFKLLQVNHDGNHRIAGFLLGYYH